MDRYMIEDAFRAAGCLWAAAQSDGDTDTVADVEKLTESLQRIKGRQPITMTLAPADLIACAPCCC